MSRFTIEQARTLLKAADVFFEIDDEKLPDGEQMLNMNDVWAWALAMGETVKDEELPELAELFWNYGYCGILYWVSQKNNCMRSEFYDNNRMIEFVEQEEKIKLDFPDHNARAYKKVTYKIKGSR